MTMETPILQKQLKPGKVQAVGILTLVSGLSNILWMLFLALFAVTPLAVVTLGLGCLLYPLVLLPIVLGVFEIIYAAKLLPTPIKPAKPSTAIAVLEIVCALTGNLLAVAAGIVALILYSDPEVKAYFAKFIPPGAAPKPAAAPVIPPAPVKAEAPAAPVLPKPEVPALAAEAIVPAAAEPAATVISLQPVTPSPAAPEQPKPVKAAQPKPARKPAKAKTSTPKPAAKAAPKAKTTKPAASASKSRPSKPAKTSKPAARKATKPGS